MFGIPGIPWFKLLAAAAVGLVIYFGYLFVTNLQEENAALRADKATLEANVATLTQAIADQESVIARQREDALRAQDIQLETFRQFQDARDRVDELEEQLERHDLAFLAANRPGLIERRINNGTDEIGRCFEIASGAPLTEEELAATRPSEINSQCPELANPNYRRNPR